MKQIAAGISVVAVWHGYYWETGAFWLGVCAMAALQVLMERYL